MRTRVATFRALSDGRRLRLRRLEAALAAVRPTLHLTTKAMATHQSRSTQLSSHSAHAACKQTASESKLSRLHERQLQRHHGRERNRDQVP